MSLTSLTSQKCCHFKVTLTEFANDNECHVIGGIHVDAKQALLCRSKCGTRSPAYQRGPST